MFRKLRIFRAEIETRMALRARSAVVRWLVWVKFDLKAVLSGKRIKRKTDHLGRRAVRCQKRRFVAPSEGAMVTSCPRFREIFGHRHVTQQG